MSATGVLDSHEYEDIIAAMQRGFMKDADKLRKLKALVGQNTVTCEQVIGIMGVTKTVWCDVAVNMYPSISDKQNFDKVLAAFQWDEERDEVKQKLGLGSSGAAAADTCCGKPRKANANFCSECGKKY